MGIMCQPAADWRLTQAADRLGCEQAMLAPPM